MSGDGVQLGNVSDPDVAVLDLTSTEDAVRYITGTTADLIRDGYDHPATWMHNGHANPEEDRAAFLIGRGWSATREKREKVANSGIPAMAVNDYPKGGPKPEYWCAGDGPSLYGNRIWDDPDVMKFTPYAHTKVARPREDAFEPVQTPVDATNSHFFHKVNDLLSMDEWLHVPYISWGTTVFGPDVPPQFHKEGAARSSMVIGMRLLWHLGYRRVYLLGCDCTPHHHPAPNYWKVMFHFIDQLRPVFDRWHYKVYQTNPDSHLRTFEFIDFDEAIFG
jgi:hypothetical protein